MSPFSNESINHIPTLELLLLLLLLVEGDKPFMFEILCVPYNLSVFLKVFVKRFWLLVIGVVCCSCVGWFPTADIVLDV